MVHRLSACLAGAAISMLLSPAVSFGQSAVPGDNSLPLFESLLNNANDIQANLAYAQSLQAAGRNDEARQIYRKVLGLDPNNPTATAALATLGPGGQLAQPSQTDFTLRWGGAFETNVARRPSAFSNNDGWVGFGELTVNDIRQLGDVLLQSNFDVYSNANTHFPSVEITYVTADTGPIFDLGANGKLRVAIGGEYLLQGSMVQPDGGHGTRKFTYDALDAIFNYFPPQPMALQSVNVLVGYNNFTHDQEFRSGVMLRTTAPMVFPELTPWHTLLIATPGFIYNGAEQSFGTPRPARYSEISMDLLSLTPLATRQLGSDTVFGKLGLFADAQFYDSRDPTQSSSDRQDQRIIPLAGIRLVNFMGTGVQVDLDYRYDKNFSNDPSERFDDHIISLIGTLRF
jgi:hypothetical protein